MEYYDDTHSKQESTLSAASLRARRSQYDELAREALSQLSGNAEYAELVKGFSQQLMRQPPSNQEELNRMVGIITMTLESVAEHRSAVARAAARAKRERASPTRPPRIGGKGPLKRVD